MATFIDNHTIYERDEYKKMVNENEKVIIMKFTAEWCKPCQLLTPILKKFMPALHSDITFYDIDVDDSFDIYAYLKSKKVIKGIPALYIYKKGDNPIAPSKSFIGADSVIKDFAQYMDELRSELPEEDNNSIYKLLPNDEEESAAEEPAVEKVATKEAAAKEPEDEEPAVEEVIAEEPATKEAAEESAAEKVATKEAAAEEVIAEEPAAKEPEDEEPATKKVTVEETAAKKHETKEPATDEPGTEVSEKKKNNVLERDDWKKLLNLVNKIKNNQ